MKHLSYAMLNQAVTTLPNNAYSKLIGKMHLTPAQMESMYRAAWDKGYFDKLLTLNEASAIQKKFKFLGPLYEDYVREKKYHLLALPAFPDTESFNDIVFMIEHKTEGLLKRFGAKTREYGVVFLNNMYFLRSIYPPETVNVDKLLALDHSRIIRLSTGDLLKNLTVIQEQYCLERYFQLITDPERDTFIIDTFHMIKKYDDLTFDLLKEILPKKPKGFQEVHDAISECTSYLKRTNFKLNQDLRYLNGVPLFDYIIEVPEDSYALVDTSKQLKHCVHSYDQKVMSKECQILNLLKDGKRSFTIELKPKGNGTYTIVQFRGHSNEKSMEDEKENMKYHHELFRLIKEMKPD